MSSTNSRAKGQQFEDLALAYLQQAGLNLVMRNWSCAYGELDLVMLENTTLVFVEVRFRKHQQYGGALESIDQRKQAKLHATAEAFLLHFPQWNDYNCRFDAVLVETQKPPHIHEINWIKDAFDV